MQRVMVQTDLPFADRAMETAGEGAGIHGGDQGWWAERWALDSA